KTTVPVAAAGLIVALKVSGVPARKAVSPTANSRSICVLCFKTVCCNTAEVEPLKFASPLYWAVMEWLPAPRAEVLKLAVPPARGRFPEIATVPSKKTTLPVADAGATLAVKVSGALNTEGLLPALRARLIVELALGLLMVCDSAADVAAFK